MRLLANINAYGGDVAMVTVTGPSMPWDRSACRHPEGVKCGGPRGCTVVPEVRYRWNRSAPDRWRELHRRAAQVVRRRTGINPMLAREWEYQKRGVLHMHVVVGMATPRERHAAQVYVQALADLAPRFDFGNVDRGRRGVGGRRSLEVVPAGRAAGYLAKYLAPSGTGKKALTETVLEQDVPRLVVYVSRHLTGRTMVTMRNLRVRRLAHVLARERGAAYPSVLEALLERPPSLQLLVGTQHEDTAELLARLPP